MEGDQPSTSGAPQAAQASAAHPVLPAAAPPLPRQEVITLPLCPSVRQQLLSAGLRTVADLQGLKPLDLAREANISPADAYEALRVAVDGRRLAGAGLQLTGARSAAEIYEIQSSAKKIVTFCPDLDAVLGGGVPTGSVTEFCGVPGVGKTQLGMQLAVDVQIPEAFGGVGGGAVYVDTEGSFMVERLVDIASAAVDHVQVGAGDWGWTGGWGLSRRCNGARARTRMPAVCFAPVGVWAAGWVVRLVPAAILAHHLLMLSLMNRGVLQSS